MLPLSGYARCFPLNRSKNSRNCSAHIRPHACVVRPSRSSWWQLGRVLNVLLLASHAVFDFSAKLLLWRGALIPRISGIDATAQACRRIVIEERIYAINQHRW